MLLRDGALRGRLHELVRAGLDLLYPPVCCGCGASGADLCDRCAQTVEPVPFPICTRCGRPQSASTMQCTDCRRVAHDPLVWTRAAALHHTPLREAIHAFKYENRPELGPLLARYLVAAFAQAPWPGVAIDAVVPVPLYAERLAERGYNQAERLATPFGAATGLPVAPDWLARTRFTRPQVGLGPAERQANVAGAFTAVTAVAGRRLLLIDDVLTTGATLRAAAHAARVAGAVAVYGLTLALPHTGVAAAQVPDSGV